MVFAELGHVSASSRKIEYISGLPWRPKGSKKQMDDEELADIITRASIDMRITPRDHPSTKALKTYPRFYVGSELRKNSHFFPFCVVVRPCRFPLLSSTSCAFT